LRGFADAGSAGEIGLGWLVSVRSAFVEALAWNLNEQGALIMAGGDAAEIAYSIADDCVPIYTFTLWQTFVDLCAWQVDLDEIGGPFADMEASARAALYLMASAMCVALWDAYVEALPDEDLPY
jgi:hypothetical protein